MVLLIIMSIFAALETLILLGVLACNQKKKKEVSDWQGKKIVETGWATKKSYLWTIATLGVPFLGLLFGTFTKVSANEIGIIYDDRYGIVDKYFDEGYHSKSIFEHVTTISTLNRDKFIDTTAQTDDGQYAEFEISITYAIEKENAPHYFRVTGGDNSDAFDDQLMGLVEKELQSTTIKYNIFDLLSEGLETARIDFESNLSTSLSTQYGITLRFAVFKDVDAGDKIEEILKAKATAEQQIEIAKKEAEAALVEAENKVKIAEQEAEAQKILADASAYAIKVQGEAEGDAANAYTEKILKMIDDLYESQGGVLTYEQCTNIVLSIVFYDTWDGVLPETLTSDSLSSLIGGLICQGQ